MTAYQATNAASSGIVLEKKIIKRLARRSDVDGIKWVSLWLTNLLGGIFLVHWSLNSWWVIVAMFIYGIFLTVPAYALSHECAHGTAFKTRWLNEVLYWFSSFIYIEEPYHRRYSHTRHHTYTWINGKDSQMPFNTPLDLRGWILEVSGIALLWYEIKIMLQNAFGRYNRHTLEFTPATELKKLKVGARIFLAGYSGLFLLIFAGYYWPLFFFFIPRLLGGPIMLLFTLIQHVEMMEDQSNILHSTRSFKTNCLGKFLYMNMNYHIEHHLYPMIPFHKLETLSCQLCEQLPNPDPGFFATNLEVLRVIMQRSRGETVTPLIRSAVSVQSKSV